MGDLWYKFATSLAARFAARYVRTMAKSRGRRRALLARVQELVTGRGNDGLTRQERKQYAQAYRDKTMRQLSTQEQEVLRAWQNSKRDQGRSVAPRLA